MIKFLLFLFHHQYGLHKKTPGTNLAIVWEHDDITFINIHNITGQLIGRGGFIDGISLFRQDGDDKKNAL